MRTREPQALRKLSLYTFGRGAIVLRNFILPGFLLFLPTCAPVHAQENCIPIQFAPGASSATVKGIARNDDPIACYNLTTRRGQTATISIVKRSSKDDTAFTIPDVIDNQDKYTFTTDARTYKILVYLTFARQPDRPFTMQVSVK